MKFPGLGLVLQYDREPLADLRCQGIELSAKPLAQLLRVDAIDLAQQDRLVIGDAMRQRSILLSVLQISPGAEPAISAWHDTDAIYAKLNSQPA